MTSPVDQPPLPPRIAPRLRLHRSELIGLPSIAVLPLLALLGVFGPGQQTAQGQSGGIEWSVEYPSRIRYAQIERVTVQLTNRSAAPISHISLGIDPDYIHAFTDVAFEPQPTSPYRVDIPALGPGESRLVAVELTADAYGAHQGRISVEADGTSADAQLSTFVFP
ncbi:MAG TPA: hypothetical protein VIG90_17440 [Pedomonas sp.]|uniref:hypothetical protein n=1 Tax=Pedomonas sp. TaxID=2976421 RepID=UPI002F3F26C4